uniref:Uncharacterized protein n=2 Tax=unclassified Caudoviricetes TaxID=2788787 RepID=A0A8S5PL65_9CAUD|nr:MAG TPA: hypothetical protein [Siphoviridae sp. ctOSJ35]DAE15987.1 MAG TPA: hypothetical protein [Siphoviridae sp. ctIOF8]
MGYMVLAHNTKRSSPSRSNLFTINFHKNTFN